MYSDDILTRYLTSNKNCIGILYYRYNTLVHLIGAVILSGASFVIQPGIKILTKMCTDQFMA